MGVLHSQLHSCESYYLPRVQNILADQLSRSFSDHHEWSLHPDVARSLFHLWGVPKWTCLKQVPTESAISSVSWESQPKFVDERIPAALEEHPTVCIPSDSIIAQSLV